ncbi:hypothetical protein [Ruegeria atlantica]|uniref:hypothetical protein n=1 Tax=Ruegeria atlantica TaxID=81569 RepID=UPI00147B0807|nr:hypothetical protein [Ruegeria atlantica]
MRRFFTVVALLPFVAACAQSPDKVGATYVSPAIFDGRSCQQLHAERNQIASNVKKLTADQKKAATDDAVITGVTLVLFWPAALAMAATQDHADQLAAAKGNYDAITQAMQTKNCPQIGVTG